MLAARVEKKHAELLRKRLLKAGVLDRDRKIVERERFVEIPLVKSLDETMKKIKGFEIVEQCSAECYKPKLSFEKIKQALRPEVGEREISYLKGGWEIVGEVLIIELPGELENKRQIIGKKFLELFPRIKTVLNRIEITHEFRKPLVEIIAGSKTETVHKENYCLFKLDASKIMFSAGNMGERKRIANISNPSEVVVDMFAGIGYFSIPVAKHSKPKKVFSIEKNPVAFEYLKESIKLNKLRNVEPIFGDCREVAPKNVADRVIMGYFFEQEKFLPAAVNALKKKGVIHYHDLAMKKEIPSRVEDVRAALRELGCEVELIEKRIVKSYAPMRWHAVFDLVVKKI
ncbi:MAG: class I SAM-dependent methyltransferase family protein [Euryarchaeota archaeon]|nr:class I SAM-dependent methyltransferase family protein [Euryarchaeota archaeon]